MENPLDNVPLNVKSQFIMVTTKDGCEVYLPVDSFDKPEHDIKKIQLQHHLDNQPMAFEPPPPLNFG